jgi:hypothetical protein
VGVVGVGVWGGFPLRSNIPRSALCATLDTYNLKLKIYYAKWTLRIEVVVGKKYIYYCIFRVYLVTGPIKGSS